MHDHLGLQAAVSTPNYYGVFLPDPDRNDVEARTPPGEPASGAGLGSSNG